jgi:dienelactone hydrolase
VGLGLGHALKHDDGPVLLIGLVLLVVGATLLGSAAVAVLRATSGWWRLPAALGMLVVTAVLVLPSWVACYAAFPGRPPLGAATPADRGLTYRDVVVRTPDGVRLAGWYVPSRNRAAVVLRHGAGSTRTAVLAQAAVLARAGYGVLLTDARGHGDSGGRGMDLGWYGDQDIAGAVTFLSRQPDVDPARIAAVGLSMGGEEAIGAAASDRRIRAVVAEGATGRTNADLAWFSDRYGLRGSLTRAWHWLLTQQLTELLTPAPEPGTLRRAAAVSAPTPILLIAGGEVGDERAAVDWIASGSPATVSVWEVPGAGHTQGLATRPHAWAARVVGFLDRALGVR